MGGGAVLVPTLRVGTHLTTLCGALSPSTLERLTLHSHAERGNQGVVGAFSISCVIFPKHN